MTAVHGAVATVEHMVRRMVAEAAEGGSPDVLDVLRAMRAVIDTATTDAARNLNERPEGRYTWAQIGEALGITRQAAFQAFARRKPLVDESERYEGLF